MRQFLILAVFMAIAAVQGGEATASKAAPEQIEADKKALAPVQLLVGGWKGGGANKAGAARDPWWEEADWSYDFKGGRGALVTTLKKAKFFSAGRLEPADKAGSFRFIGTLPDGKTKETYNGEMSKDGDLVLAAAAAPAEGRPARLTFSFIAKGARMLMLYEKKWQGERYSAIAEVGFTREGSNFGKAVDPHECIITGGTGKSTVSYKGETYWVCCGGCREAFEENPEKEIAAWKKRKAEEGKK